MTTEDDKSDSMTFQHFKEQEKYDLDFDEDFLHTLTFNHLRKQYDCGDIDQAMNTISKAFKKL